MKNKDNSTRPYNFCAGPAAIPEDVLKRVQNELLDFQGLGASVMEISHRSAEYCESVLYPAQENLRKLLNISADYEVLFITAGTSHQFAMVPLNLLDSQKSKKAKKKYSADYFYTGIWSGKAIKEAQRFGEINIAVSSEKNNFTDIDLPEKWTLNPAASYVHYTPNETIHGLQFHDIPKVGDVPLVADMCSEILSKPMDISRFGLIYAGAQKNMGTAGLSIIIIRKDLIGHAKSCTPTLYHYQTYSASQSLFNTPNTFGIYVANYVFEWLLSLGGLSEMAKINTRKAEKLYEYIDQTSFYHNPVSARCRSQMNVIFYLPKPELEKIFVAQASLQGLINLKGHKAIGGLRASIYNALPESGVDKLIIFMKDFEKKYG